MVEPLFFDANLKLEQTSVGSVFELAGAEGKHAATVRRVRPGERIQVTNGLGLRLRGVVNQAEGSSVLITVDSLVQEPKPEFQITLIQALAKGDRDEMAVQSATELGAIGVVPWQSDRSVSRWEASKIAKGVARWQAIVLEAMKQSLQVWLPEVLEPKTSKQLVSLFEHFDHVLVLDPFAETHLVDLELKGSVAVVVGPEGGISESELQMFEAAKAQGIRLGSAVLRTSTAGPSAIAVLQSRFGDWRNNSQAKVD